MAEEENGGAVEPTWLPEFPEDTKPVDTDVAKKATAERVHAKLTTTTGEVPAFFLGTEPNEIATSDRTPTLKDIKTKRTSEVEKMKERWGKGD